MFLEISNNNGTRYIRVSECIRKEVGKKRVSRKRVIENIGPVSRYDDGEPDFEQRVRQSFAAGEPIIPKLQPYVEKKKNHEQYTVTVQEFSPECTGHPKLFADVVIDKVISGIGLDRLLENGKKNSRIKYDVVGFVKLLIYGRILNPASKYATLAQNDDYYAPVVPDGFNEFNIYDALDFVFKWKRRIFSGINRKLVKAGQRDLSIIYYDVTNFFFETDRPDNDKLNEKGELIESGLRKVGVSKENRRTPIVQVGLFMDNKGIPISYEMFPGNTVDNATVRKAMASSIEGMGFSRFIFIGDRGMCSDRNLAHLVLGGNGYIISKSVLKSKAPDKEWIYDPSDYIQVGPDFKYKSKIRTRNVIDEYGQIRKITEKVVVYWDRAYHDRQVAESKSMMEFLENYCDHPYRFRIATIHASSIRQYLKNKYQNVDTGEIFNAYKLRAMIDKDKIEEEKRSYGYYQIVTSELEKTDREVIEAYRGLTRIEDQFRVMKGVLDTRPMFVRKPEHIEAHLAICMLALIIIRMIQNKALEYDPKLANGGKDWSYGMSAERIQNALNKMKVELFADDLYRFNDVDDKDLKLILDAFGIIIPPKLFKRGELRSLRKAIAES